MRLPVPVHPAADVPDGMTKEQFEALKAKERAKTAGKNLGITGVTTFRSRTLDFRAADEAKAQGDRKRYRFPDKTTGNKNNYVRREGGKKEFFGSAEYKKIMAERERDLQRKREESARITGAFGWKKPTCIVASKRRVRALASSAANAARADSRLQGPA